MPTLFAKIREIKGKKVKRLRKEGKIPAVLYGPDIENKNIEVELKEFQKIYEEAGESTLIDLDVEGEKYSVLIHDVSFHPIKNEPIHVDFYQPSLEEEVHATVPLIFEGESKAVKELGGTLVKNIQEVEVKALPQNLPKEIKVNIEKLETFEDSILISDLKVGEGVKILRDPNERVAWVSPPEKVEEELEKPIEEKVEEVEKVKEKEEEEEEEEKEKEE